ncbi:MAG: hypothetical protein RLW61_00140 [Gammaproteobacteria bacterium]
MNAASLSGWWRRCRLQARIVLALALLVLGAQVFSAWHATDLAGHAAAHEAHCADCLAHGAGHAPVPVAAWSAPVPAMAVAPPRPLALAPMLIGARPGAARAPPLPA